MNINLMNALYANHLGLASQVFPPFNFTANYYFCLKIIGHGVCMAPVQSMFSSDYCLCGTFGIKSLKRAER
jgi:hypothetical protein